MSRTRFSALAFATALSLVAPLDLRAETSVASGAYLAARQALADNDFTAAAHWTDLALPGDPTNIPMLEGAVTAHLALGEVDQAAVSGRALLALGEKNQLASLAVLAANVHAGDYAQVLADLKAGQSVGALVDKLIVAWAKVGIGRMSDAQTDFDAIVNAPATAAFGIYHKALALASTGDFEGAEKLFDRPEAAATMQLRRAVVARAQILSQLERDPDALALLDRVFGTRPDETLDALRARLTAGETVPFDAVRTASDGVAEVFFTLATALNNNGNETFVLLYTRTAATLRPDHVEAQLMSAGLLQGLGQLDQAIAVFGTIPPEDPTYVSAQIGLADTTVRAGRIDDAVASLTALVAKKPQDINALTALGDAQRRQGHCDQSVVTYDAAIALVPNLQPGNWPLLYKRASCHMELNDWPAAEADYLAALKLDPNEPRLLNELGYSYVDRGVNLDEALGMIQRAVAASPDSGYIVDSLAWAYFRLGRYADAVAPQEKASKLMPIDPVVTDHLGDIYWSVGRKREAQFQWRRALSFKPDDKDVARIERKLAEGLDIVLAEEKAAAANGN